MLRVKVCTGYKPGLHNTLLTEDACIQKQMDTMSTPCKKQPTLAWHGIIGKIHLEPEMSEGVLGYNSLLAYNS